MVLRGTSFILKSYGLNLKSSPKSSYVLQGQFSWRKTFIVLRKWELKLLTFQMKLAHLLWNDSTLNDETRVICSLNSQRRDLRHTSGCERNMSSCFAGTGLEGHFGLFLGKRRLQRIPLSLHQVSLNTMTVHTVNLYKTSIVLTLPSRIVQFVIEFASYTSLTRMWLLERNWSRTMPYLK